MTEIDTNNTEKESLRIQAEGRLQRLISQYGGSRDSVAQIIDASVEEARDTLIGIEDDHLITRVRELQQDCLKKANLFFEDDPQSRAGVYFLLMGNSYNLASGEIGTTQQRANSVLADAVEFTRLPILLQAVLNRRS